MRRAVLADTGPLYAAVDPHDARHKQALRELGKLAHEKHQVVVAYPTLLEAYTMVLHGLGRSVASVWLSELGKIAMINPTPEDYRAAFTRVRALGDKTSLYSTRPSRPWPFGWQWKYGPTIIFDVMKVPVWR